MATQKNNVVTYGLSGKIGDLLVFRQRNGRTVVAKLPERTKAVTENQLAQQHRFQQAIIYAKAAVELPETGEQYKTKAKKRRGQTAMNVAVADFFNAPNVENIDLTGYTGKIGDKIKITVSDDFEVKTVWVHISNADGTTVEEGDARQSADSLWTYTATQENESIEGDRILIHVADFPGNMDEEELWF
jgi:hypothetical protein